MQEYKRLIDDVIGRDGSDAGGSISTRLIDAVIDDVIGQLRAGFDELVHRQQAEAARAQKKYDQDIASLQKQHGEEIAQLKRSHKDEMSS